MARGHRLTSSGRQRGDYWFATTSPSLTVTDCVLNERSQTASHNERDQNRGGRGRGHQPVYENGSDDGKGHASQIERKHRPIHAESLSCEVASAGEPRSDANDAYRRLPARGCLRIWLPSVSRHGWEWGSMVWREGSREWPVRRAGVGL